jgi:hypothetical protein
MTRAPSTLYWIWPHQPKKTRLGSKSIEVLFPILMATGEQDIATCQPSLTYSHTLSWHTSRPPITTPEGVLRIRRVAREPGSLDNDAI